MKRKADRPYQTYKTTDIIIVADGYDPLAAPAHAHFDFLPYAIPMYITPLILLIVIGVLVWKFFPRGGTVRAESYTPTPTPTKPATATATATATYTAVPTFTPYPTYTPLPSITPAPVVVLPSATAAPLVEQVQELIEIDSHVITGEYTPTPLLDLKRVELERVPRLATPSTTPSPTRVWQAWHVVEFWCEPNDPGTSNDLFNCLLNAEGKILDTPRYAMSAANPEHKFYTNRAGSATMERGCHKFMLGHGSWWDVQVEDEPSALLKFHSTAPRQKCYAFWEFGETPLIVAPTAPAPAPQDTVSHAQDTAPAPPHTPRPAPSTTPTLPVITPPPTWTPGATWTAAPTYSPLPTGTPLPTRTPLPTGAPPPTFTAVPWFHTPPPQGTPVFAPTITPLVPLSDSDFALSTATPVLAPLTP